MRKQIAEPARRAGESRFVVRAGDVHKQMGLQDAMPAVCSAIGSTKFQALAGVRLVRREGPENSSTTEFTFETVSSRSFDVSRAEAILRGRYVEAGEPMQGVVPRAVIAGLLEEIFRVRNGLDAVVAVVGLGTVLAVILLASIRSPTSISCDQRSAGTRDRNDLAAPDGPMKRTAAGRYPTSRQPIFRYPGRL